MARGNLVCKTNGSALLLVRAERFTCLRMGGFRNTEHAMETFCMIQPKIGGFMAIVGQCREWCWSSTRRMICNRYR